MDRIFPYYITDGATFGQILRLLVFRNAVCIFFYALAIGAGLELAAAIV